MPKEIEILATITGMPVEELSTKLSTEDGQKEIEDKVKTFKVFRSGDEYTSHMNNYRTSVKDALYKEHHASIRESLESDLLKKHSLDFKRGEHFKTTEDLMDKILEEKVKAAKASSSGDNKELEKATARIQELTQQMNSEKESLTKQFNEKLIGKEIDSALNGVKGIIDIEKEKLDSALKFIKFEFGNEFSLREKDGKYLVFKGDEIHRDADYKEVPLEVVLQEIASRSFKVKTSPASGRGGNNQHTTSTPESFDFSGFKTWEEFLDARTDLRKLTIGDPTLNQWREAWKKQKGS